MMVAENKYANKFAFCQICWGSCGKAVLFFLGIPVG